MREDHRLFWPRPCGRNTPHRNQQDLSAGHGRHCTIGAGPQHKGGGNGQRQASPLNLIGDKAEVKHHVREQLRAQLIAQLIQRRPRLFTGMHYTTNRRLVPQCILSLASELERSLLRTISAGGGGVQTALRAHQRGLRPDCDCPFCGKAAEIEQLIFRSCEAWQNIRDSHSPNIEHLAQQF